MPPSPPADPARLGRYAVVRRLGTGGMAEVFLARSRAAEGMDKLLVVKRILPAFAGNDSFRAMFIDEARIALRLNHPNIVQVYGFESEGPLLLLIMEHVDGPDLGMVLRDLGPHGEKLPAHLAVWIAREIARALHYAHERLDEDGRPLDIVHRDISPGNVLLSYDGAVKLGDFGIARVRSASLEDAGAIKGKFGYMAPEQARGETVDRRADVYSLGALLTELLSGRPVFHGLATGGDILPRLCAGEIPLPTRTVPEAPEPLRAILARAMHPDRAERFATARELGLALTRYLHEQDEPADALVLEQYLARMHPRPGLSALPPGTLEGAPPTAHDGPPRRRSSLGVPHPRSTGSLGQAPDLLRERVHVVVLSGRVVPLAGSDRTLDTRPLFALFDALAFKADATLEHAGDERFTLVVGALNPRVDDSLRAAGLALDVLDAVAGLGLDAIDAVPGIALGLARGVAGCAREPDGTLASCEIVDDALILAEALAQAARAGEALMAGGLYRLVRRSFRLREHAARAAGGMRAYLLERAKTRAERDREAEVQAVGLVGRESDLRRLRDAFDTAVTNAAGHTVAMVGELGIGKSALLGAWANEIGQHAYVVRAQAAFGAGELPYAMPAQVVRELMAVPEEATPEAHRGLLEVAVEAAVERCDIAAPAGRRAALRALRVCMALEEDEAGAETATMQELVLVLRRLLSTRAAERPVVLVIDSVELADRQSRAVLAELARRPPQGPVLVVMALRPEDVTVLDLQVLPVIALTPLGAEARAQLIARRMEANHVAGDLVREVSSVAGGNPLMILEVVEALADRRRIRVRSGEAGSAVEFVGTREGELPLPATLEDLLTARVEAVPPEGRALLRWCSLLGSDLLVDLIDRLGGEGGPRVRARLVSDGILVSVPRRQDVLAFANPALARIARASIDPTAVPAMHARIAEVLERRQDLRGASVQMLARHREAAGAARPAARAWLEAAVAHHTAGRDRDALAAFAKVLMLCHGATDAEGYSLRFAAHQGREDIARAKSRTRARGAEIMALRSLAVEARDPKLIARALARQARYKIESSMGEGIERDVAAAARAARRADEPRAEAEARHVLALYLGRRGRYAEGLQATDQALAVLETRSALAPPTGGTAEDGLRAARTLRIEILIARGAMYRQTGETTRAIEVYAEVCALVARHGPRRLLAAVFNNLGVACFARGENEDGLRLYLASIAVAREVGHRARLGQALSNAGQAFAALGQPERALSFLRKSVAFSDAAGRQGIASVNADARVAIAELLCQQGDLEGAVAEMELARASVGPSGGKYDLMRVCLGDAIVNLARHEYHLARVAAEGAERVSREAGIPVGVLFGRAYAAQAAACERDRGAALGYLDQVLDDPIFAEPLRVERGDLVVAACERALRELGEDARAEALLARAHRAPVAAATP